MRSKKLVGYIDDCGEIHDNVVAVLVGHKIHSPYGQSWMQINQNFLKEFAARRDLGNEVLRVFLYLNARLDFENVIQVPQVEIRTSQAGVSAGVAGGAGLPHEEAQGVQETHGDCSNENRGPEGTRYESPGKQDSRRGEVS